VRLQNRIFLLFLLRVLSWSGIVRRVLYVWLPEWSIELIRRRRRPTLTTSSPSRQRPEIRFRSEAPQAESKALSGPPLIVLTRPDHGREIVAARCGAAACRGVTVGMTLAHARALAADRHLLVQPHDPLTDRRALDALARWLLRIAPIVAVDPPDGIMLDLSGCARLYPSETMLLRRVIRSLQRLGFTSHAAAAGTFAAAGAVARFAGQPLAIIPARMERQAIAPLPLAALRIDSSIAEALREVGIERIDQLLPVPRVQLVARFGLPLLIALDQALGRSPEIIHPVKTVDPPCVERCFDGPVTSIESIMLAARMLLEDLSRKLQTMESGATRLDLTLDRVDTSPMRLSVCLSTPSRSVKHLWSLLRARLEHAHLGFGVERLLLCASLTMRLRHVQQVPQHAQWPRASHEHADDDAAALGELVDTLSERLGESRVVCMQVQESHVPERAAFMVAAIDPPRRNPSTASEVATDRPSQLFAIPEPAEVIAMTPEGPPAWMRWRNREHRLPAASGPHRINSEWWRNAHNNSSNHSGGPISSGAHRDYFRVQDEQGRWLWLFRSASTGSWYVHGSWA
jgi:protein ImuB